MSTVPATITLDLNRIEDLFQAPTADPFSPNEVEILGQSGMDFLRKHYVRRWPQRRHAPELVIRLPSGLQTPDQLNTEHLKLNTRAAIRRYCDTRMQTNRSERRLAMATARRELLIAAAVTLLAIVMLAWYATSEPGGFAGYILAIATLFAVFASALTVWDALESWFFDWTPFAVENMAYRWISSLPVDIVPKTEQEAAAHE